MSFVALDKTASKIAPTASFKPLAVTPQAKVTPPSSTILNNGSAAPNFSQINNKGPVFTTTPQNNGFTYGAGTQSLQGIGDIIKNAAQGGASQFASGIDEAGTGLNTGNPIKMGEGTLNTLAGAINAVYSPLAPAFAPIGMATDYLGKQLGSHYSDNPIIPNDTATRIVQAISNGAVIAGTFMGGAEAPKAEIPASEVPKVSAPLAQAPTPRPQLIQDIKPPTIEAPKAATEAPKTVGRTTQTLKPIEGTGAVKTRGLSEGVEANAIEKKLTDNFGDLPEYKQVSMKDQAQRAASLIESDPISARAIAMGEKAPPKGLLPESVYVAAEHKATAEGDVQTLRDLANSKLSASATTMGQRIRTLGERDSASPLAAIQDVQKARAEAQAARGETPEKVTNTIKTAIRKTNTKETWSSFVNSITC